MPTATDPTSTQFRHIQTQVTQILENDFNAFLEAVDLPEPLKQACQYVMLNGGKRVRPLLVACSYLTIHSDLSDYISIDLNLNTSSNSHGIKPHDLNSSLPLSSACRRAMLSVEMLHAYSLIHDDLPCMDDDALRRGQPTCHIAFDEPTALLAGDVLQTLAFEVLTADIDNFKPISDEQISSLLKIFAPRARRMVSGQMLDLNAENKTISQQALEAIHRDKTGALIEAAVLMGGASAGAHQTHLQSLAEFAKHLGLAFQVQDDILDVTASTDALGKPTGSDEKLDKSTYVKLMGVDGATKYAKSLFDDCQNAISVQFGKDVILSALANWLWERKK